MECLVRMDNGQGIIQGGQHNTLDQPWFGKIAWLSSLYIAAARACEEMARETGDEPFVAKMRQIVERGGTNIDAELFNGEYYFSYRRPADWAKAPAVTLGSVGRFSLPAG